MPRTIFCAFVAENFAIAKPVDYTTSAPNTFDDHTPNGKIRFSTCRPATPLDLLSDGPRVRYPEQENNDDRQLDEDVFHRDQFGVYAQPLPGMTYLEIPIMLPTDKHNRGNRRRCLSIDTRHSCQMTRTQARDRRYVKRTFRRLARHTANAETRKITYAG